MTGIELGLGVALIGVLGFGGGNLFRQSKCLAKDTHDLMCKNVVLRFENKLETAKKEIIKAIHDNGNCVCTGQPEED